MDRKFDTPKQAHIYLDLLSTDHQKSVGFRRIEVFQYEGVYFVGHYEMAVACFAENNPTGGDFYVWLQDHYKTVTIN